EDAGALWRDLQGQPPVLHRNLNIAAEVPLKKMLHIIARPGDEPIQRHRNSCDDVSHLQSPCLYGQCWLEHFYCITFGGMLSCTKRQAAPARKRAQAAAPGFCR